MFIEDKVTEIFGIADDFCKFYDVMMEKQTIQPPKSGNLTPMGRFRRQKS